MTFWIEFFATQKGNTYRHLEPTSTTKQYDYNHQNFFSFDKSRNPTEHFQSLKRGEDGYYLGLRKPIKYVIKKFVICRSIWFFLRKPFFGKKKGRFPKSDGPKSDRPKSGLPQKVSKQWHFFVSSKKKVATLHHRYLSFISAKQFFSQLDLLTLL